MQYPRALILPAVCAFGWAITPSLKAQTLPTTLTNQISQSAAVKSIQMAEDQLRRINTLVEAGALPRVRLEQAQRDLADAQDAVILDRTLYGKIPIQNLTEAMATDM